jgi:hypothetical protein
VTDGLSPARALASTASGCTSPRVPSARSTHASGATGRTSALLRTTGRRTKRHIYDPWALALHAGAGGALCVTPRARSCFPLSGLIYD